MQVIEFGTSETTIGLDELGIHIFNFLDEFGRRKIYLPPGDNLGVKLYARGYVAEFNRDKTETILYQRGRVSV